MKVSSTQTASRSTLPVLAAGHRGEHAEPPLEGCLVGDTAQFGRALDGDVAAHGPDEGDPGGERLSAVLQDGARERSRQRRPHCSSTSRQLFIRVAGTRRRSARHKPQRDSPLPYRFVPSVRTPTRGDVAKQRSG